MKFDLTPYLNRAKTVFNVKVVPIWKDTVKPIWKKRKKEKTKLIAVLSLCALALSIGAPIIASQNDSVIKVVKAESTSLHVPAAGMGETLFKYTKNTGKSSVEYLTHTSVGAKYSNNYNDYYSTNGEVIGKTIVCNADNSEIVDQIPGTERIERTNKKSEVVGHIDKLNVATLISKQGEYYEILSNDVHGYVKADNFECGRPAELLDEKTYVQTATVNNDDAYLYDSRKDSAKVVAIIPEDVSYTCLKTGKNFSKIYVEGVGEGWTRNENIDLETTQVYAQSVEEEQEYDAKIEEGQKKGKQVQKEIDAERKAEKKRQKEEAKLKKQQELLEQQALEQQQYNEWVNAQPEAVQQPVVQQPIKTPKLKDGDIRQQIANYACSFAGVLPYVWAGASLQTGADCCGFTMAIYNAFGYNIARTVEGQAVQGYSVPLNQALPGDIVVYGGHVALYIGNGQIVHAPTPGQMVTITGVGIMPILDVRRIIA